MKVIVREAAYDDLDRIYAWIAKDRSHAADSVVERILASAQRLGSFPYMGHSGRVRSTYEWVVPGLPFILVYRIHIKDDLVSIDAVFHGAQSRKPEK